MFDAQWNSEEKRRAAAKRRLDPEPATMHFDDLLGDGQTEAGPAFGLSVRTLRLLKFLEYLGLVALGNAWSGVGHRDRVAAVRGRSFHRDFAGIGEFDGVADEIEQ